MSFPERRHGTIIRWLPAHLAIPLLLAATTILSLQIQVGVALFPQSAAITLGLQILILALALPAVRLPKDRATWLACGALSVFVLWAFLSALWSSLPVSVLTRGALILVPSIGLFLLTATDNQPERTFKKVALLLCATAVFLTVVALVISAVSATIDAGSFATSQAITLHNFTVSQRVMGSGWPTTVSSLTHNPNTFAAWVMLGVFATWGVYRAGHLSHLTTVIFMMIFSFGLWVSFSGSAIVSTLVAMTAFIFVDRDRMTPIKLRPIRKPVVVTFVLVAGLTVAGVTLLPAAAEAVFLRVFYDDADGMTKTASWRILFFFAVILFLAATAALYLAASRALRRSAEVTPAIVLALGSLFALTVTAMLIVILPVIDTVLPAMFGDHGGIGRTSLWKELFQFLLVNPLIGTGFGVSFETIVVANNFSAGIHNIYLALLSEIGLIGLALFAAFWAVPVSACVRILVRGDGARADGAWGYRYRMISCIFVLLIAIFVNQFFELGIVRFNAINFFWLAFLGQGLALCRAVPAA